MCREQNNGWYFPLWRDKPFITAFIVIPKGKTTHDKYSECIRVEDKPLLLKQKKQSAQCDGKYKPCSSEGDVPWFSCL